MAYWIVGLGAVLAASWLGTALVRRYALERALMDVPNHRSAHSVPVPRGGGLAIVAVLGAALVVLAGGGVLEGRTAAALAGGGAAIAGVGWLDDHGGVRPRWRALVHAAAAAWALIWLGGLPELSLGTRTLPLGVWGMILGVLGIVWMTNLYNFMDGIDGFAGGQAVAAGVFGGALLLFSDAPGLAAASLSVALAGVGFLTWNWAPARIFMGDVGSGTLGFLFAVLAVASENAGAVPLLAWAVLLGVFFFDSTTTLVRRILAGQPFYEAHSLHAYQRAVRSGWSHARVSAAALALMALLGGLAALGTLFPRFLLPAVGVALALLATVYLAVEAREPMFPGGGPAPPAGEPPLPARRPQDVG